MKFFGAFALLLSCIPAITCAAPKEPIAIKCTRRVCAVVDNASGKVLLNDLPTRTTLQPLGARFFEITTSCGSPCSATAFYERSTRKISALFDNVIAVSPDSGQVVYIDDRKLVYAPMFGKGRFTPLKIKQPLAETASAVSAIMAAAFVKPASLKLTYLSGAQFQEVTEVINLTSGT